MDRYFVRLSHKTTLEIPPRTREETDDTDDDIDEEHDEHDPVKHPRHVLPILLMVGRLRRPKGLILQGLVLQEVPVGTAGTLGKGVSGACARIAEEAAAEDFNDEL